MNSLKALIHNLQELIAKCPDCGHTIWRFHHTPGCDREYCSHNKQWISCELH